MWRTKLPKVAESWKRNDEGRKKKKWYCGGYSKPKTKSCNVVDDWIVHCVGYRKASKLVEGGFKSVEQLLPKKQCSKEMDKVHNMHKLLYKNGLIYHKDGQVIRFFWELILGINHCFFLQYLSLSFSFFLSSITFSFNSNLNVVQSQGPYWFWYSRDSNSKVNKSIIRYFQVMFTYIGEHSLKVWIWLAHWLLWKSIWIIKILNSHFEIILAYCLLLLQCTCRTIKTPPSNFDFLDIIYFLWSYPLFL